jgi:CHAT domain-containing protein
LLWNPLKLYLKNAKSVIISPDGFLGTLPFEVIQQEDDTYLIEHHSFAYLQDIASLVKMKGMKTEKADSSLLLVGSVNYLEKDTLALKKQEKKELSSNILASAEIQRSFNSFWGPLPGTNQEVQDIAAMHQMRFKDKPNRLVLQEGSASEERLKTEMPKYGFVHIATHGFFQPEGLPSMWEQAKNEAGKMEMVMRPEMRRLTGMLPGFLSGLVCAGVHAEPDEGRDDGFLTAEELTWLDLSKVDLVVLSACETGLGSPRGGEGMIGLRRSLRQAGVRTVISSLWNVRDKSTSELMRNFYQRLWLKGESKLNALRNAQLDMLKQNRIRYKGNGLPATWGAFVLDGDWR